MTETLSCYTCGRRLAAHLLHVVNRRRLLCPPCWRAWLDDNSAPEDSEPEVLRN